MSPWAARQPLQSNTFDPEPQPAPAQPQPLPLHTNRRPPSPDPDPMQAGYRELRCEMRKIMISFELATAAHPRGGIGGAAVAALRAEAARRTQAQGGARRASRGA